MEVLPLVWTIEDVRGVVVTAIRIFSWLPLKFSLRALLLVLWALDIFVYGSWCSSGLLSCLLPAP